MAITDNHNVCQTPTKKEMVKKKSGLKNTVQIFILQGESKT